MDILAANAATVLGDDGVVKLKAGCVENVACRERLVGLRCRLTGSKRGPEVKDQSLEVTYDYAIRVPGGSAPLPYSSMGAWRAVDCSDSTCTRDHVGWGPSGSRVPSVHVAWSIRATCSPVFSKPELVTIGETHVALVCGLRGHVVAVSLARGEILTSLQVQGTVTAPLRCLWSCGEA